MFDAADDTYRLARRVYDPTKPALQLVERSVIGKLSKVMTDKSTSRAVLDLFDPNVSVQSIRNAKRVLRAVDPEAFKDAKKFFVTNKLDELMRQSIDQGLPQFQQFFAKSKTKRVMQEMLEPEEYQSFSRMIEILGKAMSVPKGGSQTQPLLSLEKQLADDTSGLGMKTTKFLLAALRLPGRLVTGTAGDDFLRSVAMKQADSYYKELADALFDPEAAINIERAYQYLAPLEFGAKQAVTRGVSAGAEAITQEDEAYQPTRQQLDRMIKQQIEQNQKLLQNPQGSLDIFEPLPDVSPTPVTSGFDPATSAIVLPRADDRELAERLRGPLGGIASLA